MNQIVIVLGVALLLFGRVSHIIHGSWNRILFWGYHNYGNKESISELWFGFTRFRDFKSLYGVNSA